MEFYVHNQEYTLRGGKRSAMGAHGAPPVKLLAGRTARPGPTDCVNYRAALHTRETFRGKLVFSENEQRVSDCCLGAS